MTALITSMERALATAASDTVEVAKFVETSALPVLKTAQANSSTIEAVTGLVSPQAANIERAEFAVLGVIINAIDAAGSAAGANGLNVTLDAQLVADVKAIASAVKGAVRVSAAPAEAGGQGVQGPRVPPAFVGGRKLGRPPLGLPATLVPKSANFAKLQNPAWHVRKLVAAPGCLARDFSVLLSLFVVT